jgi:acetyl esterase/lipase
MWLGVSWAVAVAALVAADAPQTIPVWPGVAPGSESWTQKEQTITGTPVGTVVINVVKPTLTVYLPAPAKATGTGMLVVPGGAFVALAMDRGGDDAARWLADRGIAAFVLKYRTVEKRGQGIPQDLDQDNAASYGTADAVQALKDIRARAPGWRIDPQRIGAIGFSAGAMVVANALLQKDPADRPDFAALMYGAPFGKPPVVPANLPPVFMAWAADDSLAPYMSHFATDLKAAGDPLEQRIYASGGHGFSVAPRGLPSDRWTDDFWTWLTSLGFATRS